MLLLGRATAVAAMPAALDAGILLTSGGTQSGNAGDVITYTHWLTNSGDATGVFTITVQGNPAPWPITPQPDEFTETLDADEGRLLTVTVTIPESADGGMVHELSVTAQLTESVPVAVTNTTTVNVWTAVLIAPNNSGMASPGETAVYTHTVTNNSNRPETITLEADSNQNWNVQVEPTTLNLARGASGVVTVSVDVPTDAEAEVEDVTTVTATIDDPSASDSATNTTTVTAVAQVEITPDYEGEANPGETAVYTHTVTNNSNRRAEISLEVESSADWAVDVQPTTLNLARDASDVVTVYVTVPADADDEVEDVTTVTAFIGSPAASDSATNTTISRHHRVYLPAAINIKAVQWESVGSNWPSNVTARSLAVCATDPDIIVAGTIDQGVRIFNGSSWTTAASVPTGYSVTGVMINQACDRAYASLYNQGVWQGQRSGDTWTWALLGGSEVATTRSLALAGTRLFAGGDYGIRYWGNNSWLPASGINANQAVMYISAANPQDSNSLLFAVQWLNGKVYHAAGNAPATWTPLALPDVPNTEMRAVFGASSQNLVVGTQTGSYQLVGGSWQSMGISAGLRSAVFDGTTSYLGYTSHMGVYKRQGNTLPPSPLWTGWDTPPEFVYGLTLVEGQLFAATTTGVWVYSQP